MSVLTDDEIRALLEAATPGPWKAKRAPHGPIDIFDHREMDIVTVYGGGVESEHKAGNARLIAAAPSLAAEVLRLREVLRECRTDLMIAANNARNAARTDWRWEGVGEKLDARVKQADAALKGAAE